MDRDENQWEELAPGQPVYGWHVVIQAADSGRVWVCVSDAASGEPYVDRAVYTDDPQMMFRMSAAEVNQEILWLLTPHLYRQLLRAGFPSP